MTFTFEIGDGQKHGPAEGPCQHCPTGYPKLHKGCGGFFHEGWDDGFLDPEFDGGGNQHSKCSKCGKKEWDTK